MKIWKFWEHFFKENDRILLWYVITGYFSFRYM